MKKTIVSTKRLMTLAMMMVMTISANAMSYRVSGGTLTLPSHGTVLDSLPSHGSSYLILCLTC